MKISYEYSFIYLSRFNAVLNYILVKFKNLHIMNQLKFNRNNKFLIWAHILYNFIKLNRTLYSPTSSIPKNIIFGHL